MNGNGPHPFDPSHERTPGAIPAGAIVDLTMPMPQGDEARITQSGEDVIVDFAPDKQDLPFNAEDAKEHGANLARFITDTEKARIAQDVIRWVDADVEARQPWVDKLADGLVLLGVVKDASDLGPLGAAEKVTHPLLAEAAIQYQSRAITELFPSGGPAKWEVLGDVTEEKEDSADRLANFLNFTLTIQDKSYYNEFDRMLFVQSYEGSQFKKISYDPLVGTPVSRWVRGQHFIVPYGAASLQSAPRYTHEQKIEHNDVLKLQDIGFYTDDVLGEPTGTAPSDYNTIKEKKDEAEGMTPSILLGEMQPHIFLEMHANWDLAGFEHVNDKKKKTGIALPYIAHVERDSQKLLGLYRNWKEDDSLQRKRVWFVHYPFIPGDGFYSYGYVHLASGIARASTFALRVLLMGSAFASMAGGFKTKSARTTGNITLQAGVFQDTDMEFEELSKMFYSPNFKEPSQALFQTLGLLVEGGQRLFSTQDAMVGDASNTGPVGTTVALIEEGKKVFSAVHKRGHAALGEELQILRDVWKEYIPEGGYPYDIPGESREVMAEDFADYANIVPVSDPNIFSSTQRIALAQSVGQMAIANPAMDRREADSMMLRALRIPQEQINQLLPDPKDIKRADPVTENALIMAGRPVKVFVDQDHGSHYQVHQTQLQAMQAQAPQNPLIAERIPVLMAHVAEHQAYGERLGMMKMLGIELPPMDLDADMMEMPGIPPELDAMISQRAAIAVSKMPRPPQPQDLAAQADDLKKREDALAAEQEKLAKAREGIAGEQNNLITLRAQAEKESMRAKYEQDLADKDAEIRALKLQGDIEKRVNTAVDRVEKALTDMKNAALKASEASSSQGAASK